MTPATKVDINSVIRALQKDIRVLAQNDIQLTGWSAEIDEARRNGPQALAEAERAHSELLAFRSSVKRRVVEAMQIPEVAAFLKEPKNKVLNAVCISVTKE